MKKICGIYKITSPTNKIYIGQSKNIAGRYSCYKNHICNTQRKLYNSILKYGWESHDFKIICECDESELNKLEKYYITLYDTFNTENGLNLTSGGDSINLSDETKHKISISMKNRIISNETKHKMSIARKGIKLSNITKTKIGESKKGNLYSIGRKLNDTTKNKIAKKHSGTYEIYDNNSNLMYKFTGNIKMHMKKFKLPRNSLCNTYRQNKIIKQGKFAGWYMIKIS